MEDHRSPGVDAPRVGFQVLTPTRRLLRVRERDRIRQAVAGGAFRELEQQR